VATRTKQHRTRFARDLGAAEAAMSLERVAASRGATDVPVIYHYTDPKALIGILSQGQLWATDIRYLNDNSELRHAEEMSPSFWRSLRVALANLLYSSTL